MGATVRTDVSGYGTVQRLCAAERSQRCPDICIERHVSVGLDDALGSGSSGTFSSAYCCENWVLWFDVVVGFLRTTDCCQRHHSHFNLA